MTFSGHDDSTINVVLGLLLLLLLLLSALRKVDNSAGGCLLWAGTSDGRRQTCPNNERLLSCLHTSGTDELTQEEGSTAYTHTRLINYNESSAALINFPIPAVSCIGPTCRPQHWRMKGGMRHRI